MSRTRFFWVVSALVVAAFAAIMFLRTGQSSGFTITGTGQSDGEYTFETMFAEGQRFENFRYIDRFSPVKVITASSAQSELARNERYIKFSSNYRGKEAKLKTFLEETGTSAFLVIKDGQIITEQYFHGNGPTANNASFSMAKSFISALVGIAISEGHIGSVNDLIVDYLPELDTPTFQGVTIKHVLQMASGIAFNEDYSDPKSDINKMSLAVQKISYVDYIKTLGRWSEPGKMHVYASINTQILGILVARATKVSLGEYLQEKIWQPAGMEHNAIWALDAQGQEQAMGGLAISLRDYGRFGQIYLNKGNWNGSQIISSAWVQESVNPSEPFLKPGKKENSFTDFGYQYQWWIPQKQDGDFMALGIFGQTLYIDPKRNVVIVKLSADISSFESGVEYEQISYLQSLSRSL